MLRLLPSHPQLTFTLTQVLQELSQLSYKCSHILNLTFCLLISLIRFCFNFFKSGEARLLPGWFILFCSGGTYCLVIPLRVMVRLAVHSGGDSPHTVIRFLISFAPQYFICPWKLLESVSNISLVSHNGYFQILSFLLHLLPGILL